MQPKVRLISILLAEAIVEILEESGASEPEKHAALDVVRALIPVLPNASCSVDQEMVS